MKVFRCKASFQQVCYLEISKRGVVSLAATYLIPALNSSATYAIIFISTDS
jgi:hypothetical protein